MVSKRAVWRMFIFFLIFGIITAWLYCCIRVGARAEEKLQKLFWEEENGTGDE